MKFICPQCGGRRIAECRLSNRIVTEITELSGTLPVYGETEKTGPIYQFICQECREPIKTDDGRFIKDYQSLIFDMVNQIPDIGDPDWPEAVPFCSIVDPTNEKQKIKRAEDILNSFNIQAKNSSFLDFGCGEGHVVEAARKMGARFAIGYDPGYEATNNFSRIVNNSPYDVVLLYDVIDHIKEEKPIKVLEKIRSVLAPTGKVYVRCHPWCSRHGTHVYNEINKAFVHLIVGKENLPDQAHTIPIKRPSETYAQWFKESGLVVSKQETHRQEVEDYFKKKKIIGPLFSHWMSEPDIVTHNTKKQFHYHFGKSIDSHLANYGNNTGTSPVGSYPSNEIGLYDMHGNVWEWCADWFDRYPVGDQIDPAGPAAGTDKCLRGGSFGDGPNWLRTAQRGATPPNVKTGTIGFRIALDACDDPSNFADVEFVYVKAGKFMMGSPHDEPYREALGRDETMHEVSITKSFYLSKYLITQEQYKKVTGGTPSFDQGAKKPVENVTWFDAHNFCRLLSDKSHKPFRLPTEAEWEYACRGQVGKSTLDDIIGINFIDYILTC